MNVRPLLLVFVALVAGLAACDKTPSGSGSSGAAASASAPLTASAAPSAAPSATMAASAPDPLPSHTDVAKTVRGEITKQNYKTELDKLEKSADEP